MKTLLKWLILLIITIFVGYFSYTSALKINKKKKIIENIKTIPNFIFFNLKGEEITKKDLKSKPIIFIYFNSECEFCENEAQIISTRINQFLDKEIVFVSSEKTEAIENFSNRFNLKNKNNVLFLQDKNSVFTNLFDTNIVPTTIVYSKEKELIKVFKGATSIQEILRVLQKND